MIPLSKPFIGEKEKRAVLSVLDSGMLAQGPKVKELEKKFAELCGTKYAVATNSGTSALHTALYALGVGKDDEVITTPFTFVATANAVLMQNARPVFVDIDDKTFNIDPDKIEEKITEKTKAIIPVDLFGHLYDHVKIQKIAKKYGLVILEDACQAVCGERDGKKAGQCGDMAAFSFYATKNLMCGEGGIITTDNEKYAERAKRFRQHGQNEHVKYEYLDIGYNYRMMDLQAAIALEQIRRIEEFTKKRQKNAALLSKGLKQISGIVVPYVVENTKHAFHQYSVLVPAEKRENIVKGLGETGVGCGVFYPVPLHLQPHFKKFGYREGDFPIAEKISKQILSLPVNPLLSENDIQKIISSMVNCL